jgi:glycosyltransferase involved in cell wall biosynthesis
MKILFLTTQLPYPPVSGGVIKSWNLVNHFSEQELKLVCPLKDGEEEWAPKLKEKLPRVDLYTERFDKKRTPLNLLKSYFRAPSLNIYRNYNAALQRKAAQWFDWCDVVFIDHLEMAHYAYRKTDKPIVFHEHNAEFAMWERLAEVETNPLKRFFIQLEAARIRKAEKMYADDATLVLASPNDIDQLESIGVDRRKMETTYHLGEDFLLEKDDLQFDETTESLLYVGTLTWEANIDGLLWFIEKIYPRVLEKHPKIKFNIIGKNPDPRIVQATAKMESIKLLGFVDDLEPYFKSSRVFVIPLRFGSGIKVKLLNAMYRGIPTVTTPFGIEGLDAVSGRDVYCSSDEEKQALFIGSLLNSKDKWERMRDHSRKMAAQYTWKELLKRHDKTLESILTNRP